MKTGIQQTDILSTLITAAIYAVLILGLGLIYYESCRKLWIRFKMRNRLKARRKAMRTESVIEQHLRTVLTISLKKPIKPKLFLQVTTTIYLIIFLVGIQNISPMSAAIMALLISGMPYLLLRVRLETIRRKGSFEGERLISEFLSQYRICNFNIYKTIEQVVITSEGTKISGKLLFKLLLQLRNTGNPVVIKKAANEFAYGINTNWSRMLANNIRIAAERGTNVTSALEDILIQLREARALTEERKRLNSEAARMVLFLAPLTYFGTILMSVKYLDIPFLKLVRNQVYTEQGFLLLLLIIFLFFINLALIEIVNNQRFDY